MQRDTAYGGFLKDPMHKNCYFCYYMMYIHPAQDGRAIVSTCCQHAFRRENRIVVGKGIAQTWNSSYFQFQRFLVSRQSRAMCWGADCAHAPAKIVEEAVAEKDVAEAISRKDLALQYPPRYLYLVPSVECNQQCYYCYCYNGNRKSSMRAFSIQESLMEEVRRDIIPGIDYVILSGGEPFFATESIRFMDWFLEAYPQKKLLVFTNGTFLDRFGIERLMKPTIKLRISLPAMREDVYRAVTGTDNFSRVMRNLREVLHWNAAHIILYFVLSRQSASDLDDFCSFVEQNPAIRAGLIQPNYYAGRSFHALMRKSQKRYAHIGNRLIFIYRNQDILQRGLRAFYNPVHTLRYGWWAAVERCRAGKEV